MALSDKGRQYMMSSPSISARLQQVNNRPAGFDYIRIVLAVSVVCWHTAITSYGGDAQAAIWQSIWWTPFGLILPMFFALSGFLVAGSFERCKTLITFLGLRVIRIVPALAVEVGLSALVLGPIFTTFPLHQYFSDPKFFSYLLNVLGDIHFYLPGVFLSDPFSQVNTQLWTVPWELMCYVTLTCFAVATIYKRKVLLLAAVFAVYVFEAARALLHVPESFSHQFMQGPWLVEAFIAGLFYYRYRASIPLNFGVFLISLAAAMILVDRPNGGAFASLPIAYVTVYLGLLNPPRNRILLSGDYSYGIFLYGFPIQQAFVASGLTLGSWYYNILTALPCTVVVAVCSWWLIEKPAMSIRPYLNRIEGHYLARVKSIWRTA